MTKRKPTTGHQADGELEEALAVLISSTHSKKRPLPLTQIVRWLDLAVNKLGSISAVADRIGLSSKMLRQFSYVRRLSPSVQELFETRQLDSIDAAVHLAMLPKQEQRVVAQALASGEIDTGDIRAVIQLRQNGQAGQVRSLLKRVKESKARQEFVAEFVIRGNRDRASILNLFKRHVPAKEIVRLEVSGAVGRLILTEKGKRALVKSARTFGVPLRLVIPHILQGATEA
jgi:hypothetical protein